MPTGTLAADTAALTAATTSVAGTLRAVQSGVSKKIDAPASVIAALSAADARNFAAQLGLWYVVAASAVAVPLTGTASKTALATIAIPAGAMGANGIIRVTSLWSCTASANSKIMSWELGGTAILSRTETGGTIATLQDLRAVSNRNSQSSQVSPRASTIPALGTGLTGVTTATVDTSAAQNLIFYGTLANTGETITLESYIVEIKYGA